MLLLLLMIIGVLSEVSKKRGSLFSCILWISFYCFFLYFLLVSLRILFYLVSTVASTLLVQLQKRGKDKGPCFLSAAGVVKNHPPTLPFLPSFFLFHGFLQIHVTTHVTGHARMAAHWLLVSHPFSPTSFWSTFLPPLCIHSNVQTRPCRLSSIHGPLEDNALSQLAPFFSSTKPMLHLRAHHSRPSLLFLLCTIGLSPTFVVTPVSNYPQISNTCN